MTALIDQGARLFSRLQVGTRKRITVPTGALPILSPGTLLASPHRQALLQRLASLVSVSEAHFQALYLAAAEHFAGLVQQLPASEAHHHAGEGGLLDHSLEVAVIALQLRRGYLLPPGTAPEDQAKLQDLWTYAVFIAALVHDLGKPVVDQRIQLFGGHGKSAGVWDPWQGQMPDALGCYRARFVRERQHKLHERVVPLLVPRILPPVGLSWIVGNREAFAPWLAALSGSVKERVLQKDWR